MTPDYAAAPDCYEAAIAVEPKSRLVDVGATQLPCDFMMFAHNLVGLIGHADLEPATVVAHSFGGAVALRALTTQRQ